MIITIRNNELNFPVSFISASINESQSKFISSQTNIFDEIIPYAIFDPVAILNIDVIGIDNALNELPRRGDVLVLYHPGLPIQAYEIIELMQMSIRIEAHSMPSLRASYFTKFIELSDETKNAITNLASSVLVPSNSISTLKPLGIEIETSLNDFFPQFEATRIEVSVKFNVKVERTLTAISVTKKGTANANFTIEGFVHSSGIESIDISQLYLNPISLTLKASNADASSILLVSVLGHITPMLDARNEGGVVRLQSRGASVQNFELNVT